MTIAVVGAGAATLFAGQTILANLPMPTASPSRYAPAPVPSESVALASQAPEAPAVRPDTEPAVAAKPEAVPLTPASPPAPALAATPDAAPATTPVQPAPQRLRVRVADLNVRSSPSVSGRRIGRLAEDTEVMVARIQGEWVQVSIHGTVIGWVASQYLEAPSRPAGPQDAVAAATALAAAAPGPGTARPPAPEMASAFASEDGAAAYRVEASGLNVRARPSSSSRMVTGLAQGTEVDIVRTEGNWAEISVRGSVVGWVYREYLSPR